MTSNLADAARLIEHGAACHRAGRFHEAEIAYRQVLAIAPDHPEALHLLGMLAQQAGKTDDAIRLIEQALANDPKLAAAWNNLGTVYHDLGDFDRADDCYAKALAIRPDYPAAHLNRGENFKALGDVAGALAGYRAALNCDPSFREARSNYLAVINYDPEATPEFILDAHRKWGPIPGSRPVPMPFANNRDPDRKLRIGYLSPDFRKHAVARFIEPVIANHDPRQFEVHLFAEVPGGDAVTERFKSRAVGYHGTVLRSADEIADQIRHLGIDILIDLAGHTRHNRLDVFAYRSAPVQMTYLGIACTTGVPEIDYLITDSILDLPGERPRATETLARLPNCFCCFAPPENAPEIAPLPVTLGRPFTFGSHHPLVKLNDRVLALWRQVMDAVPESRQLFARSDFRPREQERFRERLSQWGIDPERVTFRQTTADEADYLAAFSEIDIVLDCFPFTGHTMTCEALWMGVPPITLRGNRANGRLSASVLTQVGLSELIAESHDEYVSIAQQMSSQTDRLRVWRMSMRGRMMERLCNGAVFTRQLESLYRDAWKQWIAGAPTPPASLPADADPNEQGVALAKVGQFEEALRCFEHACREQPDRSAAAFNLALALDRLGRWEEAVRAYERAIRLAPTDAAIHRQLAIMLQRMGRFAEADVGIRIAQQFETR